MLLERFTKSSLYFSLSLLGVVLPFVYSKVKRQKIAGFFYGIGAAQIFFSNVYCNGFGNFPIFPWFIHVYFLCTGVTNNTLLVFWKKLKPTWYNYLISLPSSWYLVYSALGSLVSPLLFGLSFVPPVLFLNQRLDTLLINSSVLALSLHSLYISAASPSFCKEIVHIDVTSDRKDCGNQVTELETNIEIHQDESKILRIFQLTDVHMGPFMSKEKLFSLCEKIAMDSMIDLVFITGDMETRDCHEDFECLKQALSPLKDISHKVIACIGNHDYEVHEKVKLAYIENNIPLLENDELLVEIPRLTQNSTKPFHVQVVGALFYYDKKTASEKTDFLFKNFPRKSKEIPRIFLIHNPAMISYVPLEDSCEIIFSGHYHGGQIRVGPKKRMTLVKTMYKTMKLIKRNRYEKVYPPDQGLYGRGKLRVYSHRGTGHYGFPMRIGITPEYSLIKLYL